MNFGLAANLDSLLNVLNTFESKDSSLIIKNQIDVSLELWYEDRYIADSVLQESIDASRRLQIDQLLLRAKLIDANRMRPIPAKLDAYKGVDSMAQDADITPSLRVAIKIQLAKRCRAVGMQEEAVSIYKDAIKIAEEHNLPNLGQLMISVSRPLIFLERYFPAVDYLTKALEIAGDHHARVYIALPNVCRKIEDWDNVIKYAKVGLEEAYRTENPKGEIFSRMQMGYAYARKGMYGEARLNATKAWELSKKTNNRVRSGIILTTLVKIELETGNYDKAIAYEKDLHFLNKSGGSASVYTHLAKAYFEKGNIEKAIELSTLALEIVDKSKNIQAYDVALYKMEANETLHKCYDLKKQFDNAYDAQSEYLSAKEVVEGKGTIINIGKALNTQELSQQKKILNLEKEQSERLFKEKINRYKVSGLLGGLLLLLGGFTVFQLRKRNKKIAEQNAIIGKALNEKDLLLREIHHRVKNNLQLISSLLTLQGRSIDDKAAIQAINEGKSRVRSMALIHQDLYNKENLTSIGVKEYLEKLTKELFATYRIDDDLISLDLDIDQIELDVDTLVPLGLIINELITNSLKYAFPDNRRGQMLVAIKKSDNKLLLRVSDDGIGFNIENVRSNSFGATLISALTDQLDGTIKVDSINGTTTEIIFKDYNTKV